MTKPIVRIPCAIILAGMLAACAPEVGSERWCAKMRDTPKGEWSANDAADYAKHCIFKSQENE